jgi:acyl-coenzyme A thioesterase PaaI-like protein
LGAFMEAAAVAELIAARPPKSSEGTRRKPRTVDISIDYLRSAKPVEVLARASVRKIGRRVAYVQVEAWQEDAAQPVAALRGHFLLGAEDEGNISPT